MSSVIYDYDFDSPLQKESIENIAESLERSAKNLRRDGSSEIYCGGTVHVSVDFTGDEPGIMVIV